MSVRIVFVALLWMLFSAASAPAGIVDLGDLLDLFEGEGIQKPQAAPLTDEQDKFKLVLQGKPVDWNIGVDDSGTFAEDFAFTFWRGTMTFSVSDGLINNDSITAGFTIRHQAGNNNPHHGDALFGDLFNFPAATIVAGDEKKRVDFNGRVEHPDEHVDIYWGFLSIADADGRINGWTFELNGIHAVPEPSTYAMAFAGIACGGYSMWRRRKRA